MEQAKYAHDGEIKEMDNVDDDDDVEVIPSANVGILKRKRKDCMSTKTKQGTGKRSRREKSDKALQVTSSDSDVIWPKASTSRTNNSGVRVPRIPHHAYVYMLKKEQERECAAMTKLLASYSPEKANLYSRTPFWLAKRANVPFNDLLFNQSGESLTPAMDSAGWPLIIKLGFEDCSYDTKWTYFTLYSLALSCKGAFKYLHTQWWDFVVRKRSLRAMHQFCGLWKLRQELERRLVNLMGEACFQTMCMGSPQQQQEYLQQFEGEISQSYRLSVVETLKWTERELRTWMCVRTRGTMSRFPLFNKQKLNSEGSKEYCTHCRCWLNDCVNNQIPTILRWPSEQLGEPDMEDLPEEVQQRYNWTAQYILERVRAEKRDLEISEIKHDYAMRIHGYHALSLPLYEDYLVTGNICVTIGKLGTPGIATILNSWLKRKQDEREDTYPLVLLGVNGSPFLMGNRYDTMSREDYKNIALYSSTTLITDELMSDATKGCRTETSTVVKLHCGPLAIKSALKERRSKKYKLLESPKNMYTHSHCNFDMQFEKQVASETFSLLSWDEYGGKLGISSSENCTTNKEQNPNHLARRIMII